MSIFLSLFTHNTRFKVFLKQDRQCTYKRNTEVHSRNNICGEKGVSVIYSECVLVALCIQHAMRVRHIVFYGLSGRTTFSTLSPACMKKFTNLTVCNKYISH